MTGLLERRPDLDAVFVASDVMALGALDALRRAGRRVPEDVAVGGFDDSSAAVAARPALTTIRQPWQRISGEMVRLLLAAIGGEPPAGGDPAHRARPPGERVTGRGGSRLPFGTWNVRGPAYGEAMSVTVAGQDLETLPA